MKGITPILFPLLVVLLCGSCAPAPEVDPTPEAGAPPPAEADPIPCYLTGDPIEIDGRPDEAAWEQAPEIPLRFDGVGNPVSPTRASARFLWDGKELFVAMTAQDRDVGSTLTGRDARLWEEDVLELFIKPLESSPLYYEFEFSPSNQIFDAYFVKRGAPLDEATAWNSGLRVAVAVDGTLNNPEDDDRGWSLELALPLAELHHAGNSVPQPGEVWKAAACRYDYDARWEQPLNTATAPVTESGGFHSYEVYGPLQFKGPPPASSQP
ncbi:MAG: carbohydrate-binding family 9-like protein [Acidobacteriota bacterium]|nr:carbohydrate-binding family 9-like protein [Acidobacteriota bacterium]